MIVDGAMILWFALTALSVLYVAVDVRTTPESPVMKWGFVLFTLYSGPFGAFFYVLSCREPLPGLHERYVAVRWRQAFGSTMHCVAGDGVGILAGAVVGSLVGLPGPADFVLEYALGFAFGWAIFQSLFMREMAGGSYTRSLRMTFIPELLSMNCLMGGMVVVSMLAWNGTAAAHHPGQALFWFRMSLALMLGFVIAYPMNWWLVANHLKHGMMTVRPGGSHAGGQAMAHESATAPTGPMASMSHQPHQPHPSIATMTLGSLALLALGVGIAFGVS